MLIDDVAIIVKAGKGGDGAATFRRNAQTAKGGPDGGNGGNGGSVYFVGSTNIFDLQQFQFKKVIRADDGVSGKKKLLFGKNATDIVVLVPLGTSVIDVDTDDEFEIHTKDQRVCIAKGGKGGRGNNEFKSATEQTPTYAEKGEQGQEKNLRLILKSIADVGLVGLPNAGKSTLLSLLTNAKPKIGDYAFTTLEPSLGVFGEYTIADIPGIIEGASHGKGLGLRFLKHIEKTKILLYCVACTDENPYDTYLSLRNEFLAYDQTLLQKPEIIVVTKKDLVDDHVLQEKIKKFGTMHVLSISKNDQESIEKLEAVLTTTLRDQ